jgi:hypothetical protein
MPHRQLKIRDGQMDSYLGDSDLDFGRISSLGEGTAALSRNQLRSGCFVTVSGKYCFQHAIQASWRCSGSTRCRMFDRSVLLRIWPYRRPKHEAHRSRGTSFITMHEIYHADLSILNTSIKLPSCLFVPGLLLLLIPP